MSTPERCNYFLCRQRQKETTGPMNIIFYIKWKDFLIRVKNTKIADLSSVKHLYQT